MPNEQIGQGMKCGVKFLIVQLAMPPSNLLRDIFNKSIYFGRASKAQGSPTSRRELSLETISEVPLKVICLRYARRSWIRLSYSKSEDFEWCACGDNEQICESISAISDFCDNKIWERETKTRLIQIWSSIYGVGVEWFHVLGMHVFHTTLACNGLLVQCNIQYFIVIAIVIIITLYRGVECCYYLSERFCTLTTVLHSTLRDQK